MTFAEMDAQNRERELAALDPYKTYLGPVGRGPYVRTLSGLKFHLADPRVDEIDIRDIAEGLSKECRYNGQCKGFYSVAEHSLLVSSVLPDRLKLAGLLHDATEAYYKDITRPLKSLLPEYQRLEHNGWLVIAARFGLDRIMDPLIKQADDAVAEAEMLQLKPRHSGDRCHKPTRPADVEILRMDHEVARFEFMDEFMRLTHARRHA
jgi:5'-deoxynucleotidase YfbR-like HD superfamily hydrolase